MDAELYRKILCSNAEDKGLRKEIASAKMVVKRPTTAITRITTTTATTDHCQKFGTKWWSRARTKAIMAAKSCKKMYGDKETSSNISIMSLWVFGARLEAC